MQRENHDVNFPGDNFHHEFYAENFLGEFLRSAQFFK